MKLRTIGVLQVIFGVFFLLVSIIGPIITINQGFGLFSDAQQAGRLEAIEPSQVLLISSSFISFMALLIALAVVLLALSINMILSGGANINKGSGKQGSGRRLV